MPRTGASRPAEAVLPMSCWPVRPAEVSMAVSLEDVGFGNAGAVGEHREVAALVRLGHVLREDRAVAAGVSRLGRLPRGPARGHLLVGDQQAQPARGNVQLD